MRQRERCPQGHDNSQPGQRYGDGSCCVCKKAAADRNYKASATKRQAQMRAYYRRHHSRNRDNQRRYKWSLRGYLSEVRTRIKQRMERNSSL